MAQEALKKIRDNVEEGLNCSICLDAYTDPKLLQCFHVYCRQCLVRLVGRDQQGKLGLTCPICRQVTPVPDRGVAGLQPAFHLHRLLEIQDSINKLDNPVDTSVIYCFKHPREEVKLYCDTCGELVCYKCALKGGKHHSHDYKELDLAFQEYQKEVTSSLEPMEKQVTTIKRALAQLDTRCGEISNQRVATKYKVQNTFRHLRYTLDVRETELISQLDQITWGKLKSLEAQKEQLETVLAQSNSCIRFMKESLWPGNKGDVLLMKPNTPQQVKELIAPHSRDSLAPSVEADIAFSARADLTDMCQNYGQLLALNSSDPSKCCATGIEVATIGKKSTSIIHAFNFQGKPYEESIESLECELVVEMPIAKKRSRELLNQYKLSYQPTMKGRHQLHVRVNSQHIKGSPFTIAVKSPVQKLGTPLLTIDGVMSPWGVAITPRGEVAITEWYRQCVSVFSPGGEKLRTFGTHGCGPGNFRKPTGIAVDNEGNILVADNANHCVQKFTVEGQFLKSVGTKGSGPLQFSSPIDIAFNASNDKVYIVDAVNDCVQVLNFDLSFSATFGRSGSGKGLLAHPYGIACDSAGKVYVADGDNHRIQVFSAEGEFVRMFGSRGQGKGELAWPSGIAIDSSDTSYVSEGANCRVSVLTSEGRFLTSFGKEGRDAGEFNKPFGLAVDTFGTVYVCDYRNNRVQTF